MKQSGECPKCNSMKIWNNSHTSGSIMLNSLKRWIIFKWSNWPSKRKHIFKDEYVCLSCGNSETYIEDKGLDTIREYGYPEGK